MALFPWSMEENILASHRLSELLAEMKVQTAQQMSCQTFEDSISMLRGLKARLEEEIAFEEQFSARFSEAMEELVRAESEEEFPHLFARHDLLAQEYFRKRGSVISVHALCNLYRDTLVRKIVNHVEKRMEDEGLGKPGAAYCFLGSGSIGRSEQTFCVDPFYVFIYGDDPGCTAYFNAFFDRSMILLERTGLFLKNGRATAVKSSWRGSRTEWRREIVEERVTEDKGRLLELARRADLRLLYGDLPLAEEMIRTVWSMLEFYHGDLLDTSTVAESAFYARAGFSLRVPGLKAVGKRIAEMPVGLDFFSRLRVERRGRHKGEFDLSRYALVPLIHNIRILAINYGLHETGTIARIKALQEHGHLSVELTERLLRAYHDFTSFKIHRQITGGCEKEGGCYIDPGDLSETDLPRLRSGLEAVSGLEKIAYLCFAEQG